MQKYANAIRKIDIRCREYFKLVKNYWLLVKKYAKKLVNNSYLLVQI